MNVLCSSWGTADLTGTQKTTTILLELQMFCVLLVHQIQMFCPFFVVQIQMFCALLVHQIQMFCALLGAPQILLELKRLLQSYWNSKDQKNQMFRALLVHRSLSCRPCLQRCFHWLFLLFWTLFPEMFPLVISSLLEIFVILLGDQIVSVSTSFSALTSESQYKLRLYNSKGIAIQELV